MGHAFDMNTRLENNRRLVKKRGYYNTMKAYLKATGGRRISAKDTDPAELEKIRKRVRRQRAYDNLLSVFSLIGSVVIAGLLVYLFYSYLLNR